MKITIENLFKEPDYQSLKLPYSDTLDVLVNGSHVYGEIYIPGEIYEAPHPAVILIHGFPGIVCNDDLAQALRRAGFVVFRPNHRGAWNSEGRYSITNCIEDAIAVAEYARLDGAKKYRIDPDRIFLVGHSMGGNTVLNATCRLPWIRGTVMITPYDLAYTFSKHQEQTFKKMIASSDGKLLRLYDESEQDRVYQNARENWKNCSFLKNAPDLENRNLLLLGASLDQIAPPKEIIEPLWKAVCEPPSTGIHKKIYYQADHSLCNVRLQLAEDIASWIYELL